MRIEPVDGPFGARVTELSLAALTDFEFAELHEAWIEHGLLVFPAQHLARDEQDAFARRFGDLEFTATALTNVRSDGSLRVDPDHDLNRSLRGNEGWHHDSTYMPVQAKGAVFTAEIIPTEGGSTGFADMRAAYDALDDDTRSIVTGRAAHHSRRYSMERAGHRITPDARGSYLLYGFEDREPPLHPIVKHHPDSGRPNLVIGQHAFAIPGLTDDESTALLDRLNDDSCAAPFTHHHEWSVGDAVLWDNRRLMHRATPHDPEQPRRMWHTRIAGDAATETALNYR